MVGCIDLHILIHVCCFRAAERGNVDSFLEEFSPLSEVIIATSLQSTNLSSPAFFFTIGAECFKSFTSNNSSSKAVDLLHYLKA